MSLADIGYQQIVVGSTQRFRPGYRRADIIGGTTTPALEQKFNELPNLGKLGIGATLGALLTYLLMRRRR